MYGGINIHIKVILLFALFFISGFLSIMITVSADDYDDYPPENGDWIITNETNISNKTLILNGNLSVLDGGVLTITNVTLILNSSFDAEHWINVSKGGTLNVVGSNITALNISNGYKFKVLGNMTIEGSKISYMGGIPHWGEGGIEIYSDNVTIQNSTISHGSVVGINIFGSSPIIINNTISLNGESGYLGGHAIYALWPSNPIIKYNRIISNYGEGIWLKYGCNATIEYNNISDNQRFGIDIHSSSPKISFNTMTNNLYGISCYEDGNYPGNMYSCSPLISNNFIYNNTSGIDVNGGNIVLINNSIVNNSWGISIEISSSKVINNTIKGSSYGIVSDFHSFLEIIDSSIMDIDMASITTWGQSNVVVVNSTFDESKLIVAEESTLTVQNYLEVVVLSRAGTPINNASIEIRDNDVPIYTFETDDSGKVTGILVTDKIYYENATSIQNITIIRVDHNLYTFDRNPRTINMRNSHTEIFIADDGEDFEDETTFYLSILLLLIVIIIGIIILRKMQKRR